MKKFTKGKLVTYVEDDDRRIPDYINSGWKEAAAGKKAESEADSRVRKAIEDVAKSRPRKAKVHATDKQVNEAIAAGETAAAESEAVDDGLLKRGE